MKTKILLVGGAGYIGTVITKFFLKRNFALMNLYQIRIMNLFLVIYEMKKF